MFTLILLFFATNLQAAETKYKIKRGDNLWTIAKKHKTTVSKLRELNDFSGTSRLKIGQSIIVKIDTSANQAITKKGKKAVQQGIEIANQACEEGEDFYEYTVRKSDSLDKIAKKFNIEKDEIIESNNLKSERLRAGKRLLIPKSEESESEEQEFITLPPENLKPWKNKDEQYMLVKVAKSFVGAPYKYGGESVRGLDCSAYVRKIYEIFDVRLPRSAREQFRVGSKIQREELSIGDLVFFRTRRYAKFPTHVGIYIGDGNFIHSSSSQRRIGVKVDSIDNDYYKRTYIGATRIKKPLEDTTVNKTTTEGVPSTS